MTAPTSALKFGPQGTSTAPNAKSRRTSLPGGFNAVVTVVCLSTSEQEIKKWSGPVSWNGPTNASYKFRFEPTGILLTSVLRDSRDWRQIAALLMSFRIHTDAREPAAGKSIRRFCGSEATRATLSVAPSQAATNSKTNGGSGQGRRKGEGRTSRQSDTDSPANGTTSGYQPVRPRLGQDPFTKARDYSKDPPHVFGPPPRRPDYPGRLPDTVEGDQPKARDGGEDGKGYSPDGRQPSGSGTGSGTHGKPTSGTGSASKQGGKQDGSAQGKQGGISAEQGGVDGENSRIFGEKFGAKQGAIGGTGKRDHFGVRGAPALIGGVNVPEELRPLTEVLLILEDVNPRKLVTDLMSNGFKRYVVKRLRERLRRQATHYAEKRMIRSASQISADKAFRSLSRIEQKHYLQHMEWEIQRQYFDKVEKAAASRVRSLRAAGKRTRKAEQLHEAAKVKPIAGRLPVNHQYAGQAVPADKLPRGYKTKGLRFTEEGFPDFGPYAVQLPNGNASVKIKLTGRRDPDELLANKAAGFNPAKPPRGYTWHHHQDGTTMQLVPLDLHTSVKHTGGRAHYRHTTGDKSAYPRTAD